MGFNDYGNNSSQNSSPIDLHHIPFNEIYNYVTLGPPPSNISYKPPRESPKYSAMMQDPMLRWTPTPSVNPTNMFTFVSDPLSPPLNMSTNPYSAYTFPESPERTPSYQQREESRSLTPEDVPTFYENTSDQRYPEEAEVNNESPTNKASGTVKPKTKGRGRPNGSAKQKKPQTDEEAKRQLYLERNRQAALKCRQRKKVVTTSLQDQADALSAENAQLQQTLMGLRDNLARLSSLYPSLVNADNLPLANSFYPATGSNLHFVSQ